jgi:hypothetical protein
MQKMRPNFCGSFPSGQCMGLRPDNPWHGLDYNNNLEEPFQSAYKFFHSVETTLLKVQNDILLTIDNRKCVVLLLLDMLQWMFKRFGIDGQVLKWFESYLQDRMQSVVIDGVKSISKDLRCGVPQWSVLGPILYLLYTSPLGDIIRDHGFDFHFFADDSQLYLAFESTTEGKLRAMVQMKCVWRDWFVDGQKQIEIEWGQDWATGNQCKISFMPLCSFSLIDYKMYKTALLDFWQEGKNTIILLH